MNEKLTPRERVLTALRHQQPDRTPVDFLATNEIWHGLLKELQIDDEKVEPSAFYEAKKEALLRHFEVDMRLLSYDMFCAPPESKLRPGAKIEWWDVFSRSTPNRMWRQVTPEGDLYGIFGRHWRVVHHAMGAYEENATSPLAPYADSVEHLKQFDWPEPDWWDFSPIPEIMAQMDRHEAYHIRFRIGSVFEIAWQLRGMAEFLMEMAIAPQITTYIMERITDILVENTRRVLEIAGERLDMVYFYDDVAVNANLMISKKMWEQQIRPCHARLIEVARAYGKPVMYHCDGSIRKLIPELIDMGVDLLNPIQPTATGMDPRELKDEFGERLSFHGGIDIMQTLPSGTPEQVQAEVEDRVCVLGENGGYVMCSSHHIQPDTPIDNVLAMYDLDIRTCQQ